MATEQTPEPDVGDVEQEMPTDILDALHRFQKRAFDLSLTPDADGQVGSRDYRYLSLAKLHKQAMPLLNELGLIWATFPVEHEGRPALRYSLAFNRRDENGQPEKLQGVMLLMLDRENSQGQGSAITYARRQALSCVLGLVPDDDDDGAAASDERLVVSRKLTVDELARTREAFAEAGENFDEALAYVGVESADELTLAQGHQLRGILKLKVGES